MSRLRTRGERVIRPGALAEFREVTAAAMEHHRRHDGPGTLAFDTYLDEERGVWIALEDYVDSAAMLEHLARRDPVLSDLLTPLSDIGRVEVYGSPSPELAAFFAPAGDRVTVFRPLDAWRKAANCDG